MHMKGVVLRVTSDTRPIFPHVFLTPVCVASDESGCMPLICFQTLQRNCFRGIFNPGYPPLRCS